MKHEWRKHEKPLYLPQNKPEIKHYMPRRFKAFPLMSKENKLNNFIIFNQIIEKPERKLYFFPASKATHYFEYSEEVGCDIWGPSGPLSYNAIV